MKRDNKLIGAGLFTAVTASLCCITPVLTIMAGTSGIASVFSWIEPFRPYLISVTILVLGVVWYQKLQSKKAIDCECEIDDAPAGKVRKTEFFQSKTFLSIVSLFAIIMLAFPYYSGIFYPRSDKQIIVVDKSDLVTAEFKISGMTCSSCEDHVNHEVNKLSGIVMTKSSYENGSAIIEFDSTKTNEMEIEKVINSTGYTVTSKKQN